MQRLSGLDAGFVYMETPTLHMHTLKLAVLDPPAGVGAGSFEFMRDEIGRRLHLLPPLRRRLVDVPFGFHHPVWIDDPDFDLTHHVHRVVVRAPGGRRELDELVGRLASRPLDRRRPLWEMYVVEGLAGGRIAVLVKIHHAVADGNAASALLVNVMTDSAADHGPPPTMPFRPEPVPTGSQLLLAALVDHLRQLGALPRLVAHTLRNLRLLVAHRRVSSVTPPRPMLDTPRTVFNAALTADRAFATTSIALADARAVRAALGVSLNDVVLGLVAGSLRGYLLERGALPPRSLVAGVPVGADDAAVAAGTAEPRLGGNRVSNLFTTLATDVDDPVERLRAIHRVTAEAKEMQRLLGTDTFASWVQYTPPRPYAWVVRQFSRRRLADRLAPAINVVVSNVPGPRAPLFAGGAPLVELYSVGPVLEGIGLNVTVWSYTDRLYVGVLSCPATLPDPERIADGMVAALAELEACAAALM